MIQVLMKTKKFTCVDFVSPSLLVFINDFLVVSLQDGYSFVLRSPEQLAVKLSGHSIHLWPSDGQLLLLSLSVRYAILHKIGISN